MNLADRPKIKQFPLPARFRIHTELQAKFINNIMEEVNVTIYQDGSTYYGVNQADNTIISTQRTKRLVLLHIKSHMKDLGNNCKLNYYEKDGRLIKSQLIKIKKPKHFYKHEVKKIGKHVARSNQNRIKFKRAAKNPN